MTEGLKTLNNRLDEQGYSCIISLFDRAFYEKDKQVYKISFFDKRIDLNKPELNLDLELVETEYENLLKKLLIEIRHTLIQYINPDYLQPLIDEIIEKYIENDYSIADINHYNSSSNLIDYVFKNKTKLEDLTIDKLNYIRYDFPITESSYSAKSCVIHSNTIHNDYGYKYVVDSTCPTAFRKFSEFKEFLKVHNLKIKDSEITNYKMTKDKILLIYFEPNVYKNKSFWTPEEVRGLNHLVALENGSYVDCYYKQFKDKTIILRPNPNAKDVYKPITNIDSIYCKSEIDDLPLESIESLILDITNNSKPLLMKSPFEEVNLSEIDQELEKE